MNEILRKLKYRLTVPVIAGSLLLSPVLIIAQAESLEDKLEETLQKAEEAFENLEIEVEEKQEESGATSVVASIVFNNHNKKKGAPKLGLFLDDLDFEEAYQKHYPYNYGVLVTGIVSDGNAEKAGLIKGDIIMEFDGDQVRFEDHLMNLRDSKKVGDSASVKVFRNEKILDFTLTLYPPEPEKDRDGKPATKIKRLSPGYGGGGFEPVFIDFDFAGLNDYLNHNGFGDLTEGYTITFGGGGMGNIGKGWFIGGMGGGMESKEQIQVLNDNDALIGYRKYKLGFGYGGVTLTKKYPLFTERLVLDFGTMLGGGGIQLEMAQTDGDFSWGNQISDGGTYSVKYSKGFFAYRPSVGLLVRIKNWIGVHGSVGYFGTYAPTAKWKEDLYDFNVLAAAGQSSPELPNGVSYSLGVWFGF